MSTLNNKVVIVTGASSGVGREAALLFAQTGAKVVLGARRAGALDGVVQEIVEAGGFGVARAGDVRDEAYARDLVALAVEAFGGLDAAFNNAGTLGVGGPAVSMSLSEWEDTLAVNLTGAFLGAKYQIPEMLKRGAGALVFASSFVGHGVGFPGMAAYGASKAGLVGLTQVLASEYGPQGIRVNALLPGGIDTPMGRQAANTEESLAWVRGLHAMRRIAEPREIAQAALFLCSDPSSFMTGAAMVVDGGVSITRT